MVYKNPVVLFFGKQKTGRVAPARVPYKEPDRPKTVTNESKRKQLESILNKEKRKEKRERVGSVLLSRLVDKFGSKNRAIVNFFVEEFLNTHDQITSEDVNALEREIQNAIRLKNSEPSGVSKANGDENGKSVKIAPAPEVSDLPSRPQSGTEWQAIQAYQNILAEEADRKEKEKAHLKKLKYKKNLDEHVKVAESLKDFAPPGELNDKDYAAYVHKDIAKYHEEEARKEAALRKKYADEMLIRKQQIEDHQRRIEEEREKIRLMDQRNLQRAQEQLARENEAMNQKKLREQERRRIIEAENEENLRRRQARKLAEAENDQRLMREYAEKLDREQKAREDAFQKRVDEMAAYALKFESEGAGKVEREERHKEDQLRIKEQQRKEQMDLEKEQKKERDRRQRMIDAMTENQRQLAEQARIAEEERAKDQALRVKFQADLDEYKRSEEEKVRQLRERQANYRNTLNKQLDSQKVSTFKTNGISAAEKGINMSTLKEISADPHMLSRVLHRVRIGTSSSPKKH